MCTGRSSREQESAARDEHGLPSLGAAVAALALALPAVSPLLARFLPRGGDILLHYYRLIAVDASVRRGLLFTRWMPDLIYGYGYPLFHYYAPLSTYVAELPHLLGLSAELSIRVALLFSVSLLAVGAYLWIRELTSSAAAGCVAAAASIYAPFVLATFLSRGSVSDGLALAILPFAFWSLERLAREPHSRRMAVSGAVTALLLLSHNVTGFVGLVLLILYSASLLLRHAERWSAAYFAGALFLGAAISAFFWLPALSDLGWTRLHSMIALPQYDYRNNFVSAAYLFQPSARAMTGLMNPPPPYHASAATLLLGMIGLLRAWRLRLGSRYQLLVLWISGLALLYLTLPESGWLWERAPLLQVIQFPFRLIGPASIALAAPAAASFVWANSGMQRGTWPRTLVTCGTLVVLIVPSLSELYPLYVTAPLGSTQSDVTSYQQHSGALGTTSLGEYLPSAAEQLPDGPAFPGMDAGASLASKLDDTSLPEGARVVRAAGGALGAEWSLTSPSDFEVVVRTFFFPGWRADIDGRLVAVSPAERTGLITVAIPAGEHAFSLRYQGTVASQWGDRISVSALAAWLFALCWRRGPRRRARPAPSQLSLRIGLPFVLVATGLLVAKAVYLDRADTIWRAGFDGQHVPGAEHTVNVDLGGKVRLLALSTIPHEIESGATLGLVLYWTALQPLSENFSATVQILDERGEKVGQEDHYWPGGYPTEWWASGEYNRDSYSIRISPEAAPGVYEVVAALYDGAGRRLQPALTLPGADRRLVELDRIQVVSAVPP